MADETVEVWQLAEQFDVPEEVVRAAVEQYRVQRDRLAAWSHVQEGPWRCFVTAEELEQRVGHINRRPAPLVEAWE